jgi:hypothetical protein
MAGGAYGYVPSLYTGGPAGHWAVAAAVAQTSAMPSHDHVAMYDNSGLKVEETRPGVERRFA